jgi:hypothetical protein
MATKKKEDNDGMSEALKKKMGIYDADHPRSSRVNFERFVNPSDKYGSIREFGTEEKVKRDKDRSAKKAVLSVASAPLVIPLETLTEEMPRERATPMGGAAEYLGSRGKAAAKALKNAAKNVRESFGELQGATQQEEDLDRELASQVRRETRGMKKGGAVKSASSRADGCAKRGKTRGKMV